MRIVILPSAEDHLITATEIHTVINHPQLRARIAARRPQAQPFVYTGPADSNQPWIEIIADHADPTTAVVFHAMMLRPAFVASLGIGHLINPEYATQRA